MGKRNLQNGFFNQMPFKDIERHCRHRMKKKSKNIAYLGYIK